MKKKYKITIGLILFALLLGFYTMEYRKVNKKYPKAISVVSNGKKWSDYGNGCLLKVEGYRFVDDDEVRSAGDIVHMEMFNEPMKLLNVEVSFKNTGNTLETVDLTKLQAESEGWCNGILIEYGRVYNQNGMEVFFELSPEEEKKVTLSYLMLESHFTPKDWRNISSRKFWLTFNLYPEKKMVTFM